MRYVDAIVGSPPYAHDRTPREVRPPGYQAETASSYSPRCYGRAAGQLGAMPAGDLEDAIMIVDAIVGSPPYAESLDGNQSSPEATAKAMRRRGCTEQAIAKACTPGSHTGSLGYGTTTGQLGSMPSGDLGEVIMRVVDVILGSPPYAESLNSRGNGIDVSKIKEPRARSPGSNKRRDESSAGYGTTDGNLGHMTAGTAPTAGETMHTVAVDQWEKCYGEQWKGLIVPEAFSHPAKYARGLIRRIYEHLALPPGAVVLDPFGGVALGALDALLSGLTWVGCELEPKFHALGNANLDWWRERWGRTAGFGTATLLQGDSRRLREVVGPVLADVCVSSPPYAECLNSKGNGIDWQKSQTPAASWHRRTDQLSEGYGTTPGNLGQMRPGTPPSADATADALVSSPPWEGSLAGGEGSTAPHDTTGLLGKVYADRKKSLHNGPTYMSQEWLEERKRQAKLEGNLAKLPSEAKDPDYPTFWGAAAAVVAEAVALLRPGGKAVWVLKRFVRGGAIVEFPSQWVALCQAAGLRLTCWHRAMLVEDMGEDPNLFGASKRKQKERASFFRRLSVKKGAPPILWEDVVCTEKA